MNKEKPILFNSAMVRAILEGRKTQTRHPLKPQPRVESNGFAWLPTRTGKVKYPFNSGDVLWVRETWRKRTSVECAKYEYEYAATRTVLTEAMREVFGGKWRPSIHMPRAASRILLEITAVRLERLQVISNEDAIAEGYEATNKRFGGCQNPSNALQGKCPKGCNCFNARENFIGLWDSINAKRGSGWDSNPWVWVVEFKKTEGKIEHNGFLKIK